MFIKWGLPAAFALDCMEHYQQSVVFLHPDGSFHSLYNVQKIATDVVIQVTETLGDLLVFILT